MGHSFHTVITFITKLFRDTWRLRDKYVFALASESYSQCKTTPKNEVLQLARTQQIVTKHSRHMHENFTRFMDYARIKIYFYWQRHTFIFLSKTVHTRWFWLNREHFDPKVDLIHAQIEFLRVAPLDFICFRCVHFPRFSLCDNCTIRRRNQTKEFRLAFNR